MRAGPASVFGMGGAGSPNLGDRAMCWTVLVVGMMVGASVGAVIMGVIAMGAIDRR